MKRPSTSDYRAAPLLRQWLQFTLHLALTAGLPDDRLGTEAPSMSQDWIKMRSCLWTDPNTTKLVDQLIDAYANALSTRDVTRYVTVALLMRTWWAVNEHCEPADEQDDDNYDVVIYNFQPADVDDWVGITGWGDMLSSVGWLKYDPKLKCTFFPNFLEHNNVEHSRSTTKAAIRQREYRARKKAGGGCDNERNALHNGHSDKGVTPSTSTSVTTTKKKKEVLPEILNTSEFKASWERYLTHRREKRSTLTPTASKRLLVKLAKWGEVRAVAALEHSVANGYTGVFEGKDDVGTQNRGGRIPAEPGQYAELDA